MYYRVREGLGFNKTPTEYGAFPTDPYSHTTGHSGARQPGMTGQVKEEVLTRFGELGVRVADGAVAFEPSLLRSREFLADAGTYRCLSLDGTWEDVAVPENGLAFSFCQVPVVYALTESNSEGIVATLADGTEDAIESLGLSPDLSAELFDRSGRVRRLTVTISRDRLFTE